MCKKGRRNEVAGAGCLLFKVSYRLSFQCVVYTMFQFVNFVSLSLMNKLLQTVSAFHASKSLGWISREMKCHKSGAIHKAATTSTVQWFLHAITIGICTVPSIPMNTRNHLCIVSDMKCKQSLEYLKTRRTSSQHQKMCPLNIRSPQLFPGQPRPIRVKISNIVVGCVETIPGLSPKQ